MNKRLFVLICSIILFQYIHSSTCTETAIEDGCTGKETSASNKKCVDGTETNCIEDDILCSDSSLQNPSDDLCRTLKTDAGKICYKDGTGCKSETKCDDATGDDDNACKKFPVATKGNICKKDTTKDSTKCKEVKEESTKNEANNLKISLAFLISLILF